MTDFTHHTLSTKDDNYNNWVALFKVQCISCKVSNHITPPATTDSSSFSALPTDQWLHLDAIILQWIYSTISTDLLATILDPENTAATAWSALKKLFVDNKSTRAVNLQQAETLPTFSKARSSLVLEEGHKARQETEAGAALTTAADPIPAPAPAPVAATVADQDATRASGHGQDFPRRGHGGRGRGRGGRRRGAFDPPMQWIHPYQWSFDFPVPMCFTSPALSCPYPSSLVPHPMPGSAGLLGPEPSASYTSSAYGYTTTQIDQAFNAMTLHPDQQCYMDTGATHHMVNSSGNLSSPPTAFKCIIVGNSASMPTTGIGQSTLPPPFPLLKLPSILVSLSLIKNLLSVCRLTTDNNISI
uniref:uncharacterized protein LOC122597045 n=1 Tax=Erigeron canadensis TaxID=72917 RepID=UPI001CB957DC|nr:uncharacterized protein LOC122597045 [Erigeron canadensis]